MFCPGCGSEERHASQFCRACGTDLRAVRVSIERPDSITASAVSAREDIGRAVAEKIREVEDSRDLKRVAEDVLPQIEKFLESPEEKRLRRMRAGVISAAVGFGASLVALLLLTTRPPTDVSQMLVLGLGLAIVLFFIGIGFVINGMLFSRPRKELEDQSLKAESQNLLDAGYNASQLRPPAEGQPTFRSQTTSDLARSGSSVTEHTTKHLKTDR